MYYCGWDGGGSKTQVCILDQQGTTIAEATFGSLNPNGATIEIVNETIKNCIAFMKSAMTDINRCIGLVIGLAGISNKNTAIIPIDIRAIIIIVSPPLIVICLLIAFYTSGKKIYFTPTLLFLNY